MNRYLTPIEVMLIHRVMIERFGLLTAFGTLWSPRFSVQVHKEGLSPFLRLVLLSDNLTTQK